MTKRRATAFLSLSLITGCHELGPTSFINISGDVTHYVSGAPLPGVRLMLMRDYFYAPGLSTWAAAGYAQTRRDGTFTLNVKIDIEACAVQTSSQFFLVDVDSLFIVLGSGSVTCDHSYVMHLRAGPEAVGYEVLPTPASVPVGSVTPLTVEVLYADGSRDTARTRTLGAMELGHVNWYIDEEMFGTCGEVADFGGNVFEYRAPAVVPTTSCGEAPTGSVALTSSSPVRTTVIRITP